MRIINIIGFIFLLIFSSCSESESILKSEQKNSYKEKITLELDLSSDEEIIASYIVPLKLKNISQSKLVVLPFKSKNFLKSNGFFSSCATYNNSTIINYTVLINNNQNYFTANLFPIWKDNLSVNENSGLLWIRSGLNRQLLLKFNVEHDEDFKNLYILSDSVSIVGITIPPDSKVIESRDKNNNIILSEIRDSKRFYNVKTLTNNELKFEYQIPPSPKQKMITDLLIKGLLLLTVPIFELFCRNKKIIIILTISEVVLILGIFMLTIKTESYNELYVFVLEFIALVFTVIIVLIKNKKNVDGFKEVAKNLLI